MRSALDAAGYTEVSLLSYTAKYASAFYGPFREALDSAPNATGNIPNHKKTYQMDPGNKREAVREAQLDEAEGADIMMVKPAGPYLDIIHTLRETSTLPIAAYHVRLSALLNCVRRLYVACLCSYTLTRCDTQIRIPLQHRHCR